MATFIKQLNQTKFVKEIVSIQTLQVGEKHRILSFSILNTRYGEKVLVDFKNFRSILPDRFLLEFSSERIEDLNKQISGGLQIFLKSLGSSGKTTNIEFVIEE